MNFNFKLIVSDLRTVSSKLLNAQRKYVAELKAAQAAAGLKDHKIVLDENDAAYKLYREIENQYYKPYTGETSDRNEVWAAILRGEAFPRFPYTCLPAGEHEYWWQTFQSSNWWTMSALEQSGWAPHKYRASVWIKTEAEPQRFLAVYNNFE